MRFKKLSLEKQIGGYFIIVVLIISTVVVISYKIGNQNKKNKDLVSYSESLSVQLDTLESKLKDQVIESRAYVISGEQIYLSRATILRNEINAKILNLSRSIKNTELVARFRQLRVNLQDFENKRMALLTFKTKKESDSVKLGRLMLESNTSLIALKKQFTLLKFKQKQLLENRKKEYQKTLQRAAQTIRILLLSFIISLFIAFLIIYRAIRKKNKAESALLKNKELIESIITYAPVLVNVKDLEGKYILANKQFALALNTTQEQLLGKTSSSFLSAATAERISKEDTEIAKTERTSELQLVLPASDGPHTYITSQFPLYDDKGKLYAIGSTSADITPVIKAHKELEESYSLQQKFFNGLQQVLSSSSDLICVINEHGEIVRISDTSQTLFGYSPKEMMHKFFRDFVVEEDRIKTEKAFAEIKDGQSVIDFSNSYRTRDGSVLPLIWSATWSKEDQLMYCVARNGTMRKRTEEQLAQSESSLLNAQKIARLGSWEWDIRNDRLSGSAEMYHLLKLEKKTAIDFKFLLNESIHPDDKNKMARAIKDALTNGKRIDIEHRLIQSDGEVCFMRSIGEVRFDAGGKPTCLSGTMQDISERKKDQKMLEQLNERLAKRAQELQASNSELEQFAYIASHDLQEPLRMVSSFLTLLEKRLSGKLDNAGKQYIHFAIDGAERMKQLIQDLLQYSRLGNGKESIEAVNLNEVLGNTLTTFGPLIAETGAEIKTGTLPIVFGNQTQLAQVFQNLIGNALKYNDGKKPLIKIAAVEHEQHWELSVTDNGIGIDPKFHEKIFTIFQRLHNKKEYGGTGIGLSIAKKVIERHGGKIWLDSKPGQGTSFFFTLKKKPDEKRN